MVQRLSPCEVAEVLDTDSGVVEPLPDTIVPLEVRAELSFSAHSSEGALELLRKMAPRYMEKVEQHDSWGIAFDLDLPKYRQAKYWNNPLESRVRHTFLSFYHSLSSLPLSPLSRSLSSLSLSRLSLSPPSLSSLFLSSPLSFSPHSPLSPSHLPSCRALLVAIVGCCLRVQLPLAPEMRIYSLYGTGKATERSYAYRVSDSPLCGHLPFLVDTNATDAAAYVNRGIRLANGDGTVPLLSNGFMGVKGWKEVRSVEEGLEEGPLVPVSLSSLCRSLSLSRLPPPFLRSLSLSCSLHLLLSPPLALSTSRSLRVSLSPPPVLVHSLSTVLSSSLLTSVGAVQPRRYCHGDEGVPPRARVSHCWRPF